MKTIVRYLGITVYLIAATALFILKAAVGFLPKP